MSRTRTRCGATTTRPQQRSSRAWRAQGTTASLINRIHRGSVGRTGRGRGKHPHIPVLKRGVDAAKLGPPVLRVLEKLHTVTERDQNVTCTRKMARVPSRQTMAKGPEMLKSPERRAHPSFNLRCSLLLVPQLFRDVMLTKTPQNAPEDIPSRDLVRLSKPYYVHCPRFRRSPHNP